MNVEIRDSRQKHVIRCAENTFFEKGFSKATISDICKAANCSRSTLYIHFENKENIYLAVINNAFKIFLKYFEDLTVEGQNGLENMILYSEGFVDYSTKFPKRYSLIIDFYTLLRSITNEELLSDSAVILSECSFFPEVQTRAEIPFKFLTDVIRTGQNDGSINRDIPANELWLNTWAYLIGASSVFNFSTVNKEVSILGSKLKNPEDCVMHFIRKILS